MNDGDTTTEFIEAKTERQDIKLTNPINKKAKKKDPTESTGKIAFIDMSAKSKHQQINKHHLFPQNPPTKDFKRTCQPTVVAITRND